MTHPVPFTTLTSKLNPKGDIKMGTICGGMLAGNHVAIERIVEIFGRRTP